MHEREWPDEGELVVCTVADVKDFAAFVTLDEYDGRRGLIPISEIARAGSSTSGTTYGKDRRSSAKS
jgi:translation initiation factor 2 alpha subunit (eIF-2alpha)